MSSSLFGSWGNWVTGNFCYLKQRRWLFSRVSRAQMVKHTLLDSSPRISADWGRDTSWMLVTLVSFSGTAKLGPQSSDGTTLRVLFIVLSDIHSHYLWQWRDHTWITKGHENERLGLRLAFKKWKIQGKNTKMRLKAVCCPLSRLPSGQGKRPRLLIWRL